MVKETNKRFQHTLTEETDKMLTEIAKQYGMSKSGAINMIILVFHSERINKR